MLNKNGKKKKRIHAPLLVPELHSLEVLHNYFMSL